MFICDGKYIVKIMQFLKLEIHLMDMVLFQLDADAHRKEGKS